MISSSLFFLLFSLLFGSLLISSNCQAIVIRNIGCKTYNSSNACIACSVRYYLDQNGICQPVNPNCNTYDSNGNCLTCYPGYGLIEGTCLPGIVTNNFDPNCNTFSGSACILCSKGFYLANNGTCVAVSPSCNTFNPTNGQCTSCFSGYAVQNGICMVSQSATAIANCNQINETTGLCMKCSFGFYFNNQGVCVQQDPNCKAFNNQYQCIQCYDGYSLTIGSACVKSNVAAVDPNCQAFNGTKCLQCSKGAIFNLNGVCIIVNPLCQTFDQISGACTSCYAGYTLNGSSCIPSNTTNSSDPNCKTFLAPDVCAQCSQRYFINNLGVCQAVNPQCNIYDLNTGQCITCYSGYALVSSACIVSVTPITDQYCKTWNGTTCTQCSFGAYFLPNNTCAVANPLCKTFSTSNGICLTCYESFTLSNGGCVKSNQTLTDPNCAQFFQGACLKCSQGYIFLDSGLCGMVNPNCKQFSNLTGLCTSCFLGYALSNGACINSTTDVSAIDPNCASFANNTCIKCSKNFYFGLNGLCTAVSPLCNGFNPLTGGCTGCYQSYVLQGSICVLNQNNSLTDPNCASWLQNVCIMCASRTFMNGSGLCQNVNVNCNTYNGASGQCTSCYPGFQLNSGQCQQAISASSCNKINADGSCAVCGQGSYLSSGLCIMIDPQCANFNLSSLSCQSCYPGYSILNGVCQISKVSSQFQVDNCYAYDQQNECISCFDRYYLSSNTCNQVSVFCKTYDNTTGQCLSCYTSFTWVNGACQSG